MYDIIDFNSYKYFLNLLEDFIKSNENIILDKIIDNDKLFNKILQDPQGFYS